MAHRLTRGLLAHLADRFVTQREDLATEALVYILNQSETARREVGRILSDFEAPVDGALSFRSQSVGASQERPDLVCLADGVERALFEMKFWAGLTDNQPVTYLERLRDAGGVALVFVAPEIRLEILWAELERRIQKAGLDMTPRLEPLPNAFVASTEEVRLCAISWAALLGRIDSALASGGEASLRESLGQLRALCAREDTDAFLPLEGPELTSSFPRRLKQFGSLVDDAVAQLVQEGLGDTKGMRSAAGNGWYGRYVRLANAACLVHVSGRKWAEVESTPLWVRVKDSDWAVSHELRAALEVAQSHGRLRFFDRGDGLEVPISLPLGCERPEVLAEVLAQIRDLIAVLESAQLPRSPATGEMSSDDEDED